MKELRDAAVTNLWDRSAEGCATADEILQSLKRVADGDTSHFDRLVEEEMVALEQLWRQERRSGGAA